MRKTGNRQRLPVITVNGIIATLYLTLTILVTLVSLGPIQFRASESLNHLVVFNRKLFQGVLGGVIVYNAFFGFGTMGVVFGGGQALLSLGLTALLQNKVKSTEMRLVLNTIFSTTSMELIVYVLVPAGDQAFWATHNMLALSESIAMAVSAPLIYYLDRAFDFEECIQL